MITFIIYLIGAIISQELLGTQFEGLIYLIGCFAGIIGANIVGRD